MNSCLPINHFKFTATSRVASRAMLLYKLFMRSFVCMEERKKKLGKKEKPRQNEKFDNFNLNGKLLKVFLIFFLI